MAEDDDETFPPEIQKLPTEFAFREFGRLQLINDENESLLHFRSKLLTVANTYGLLFVGCTAGFKVFSDSSLFDATKSEEEVKPQPLVDVPLRTPPHWLAVSADNLTLAICSSSEKGLQLLFFDTRNLINKAKLTKTPFCSFAISKSPNDKVTSLHWNPSQENAQYLAVCVSSGSFHMLSVSNDVQELGRKAPEFGACSACWSPRGKQVMIGKMDGSMQQYTPALEIRRTIPVYDAVERNVKVDDILWLSTLQVAFSYTPVAEGEWQPSLFVVNLPPAKEQNKTPSWRNYEDPCYGMAQQRPPHFMMTFLDKWNMFVMNSADASDTAVIGKNKQTELWEIWNLDDSCRAQLPMEDDNEEPSPLGVDVLYTAQDRIVVDDTRECGPMPVFVMLSCDGHLSLFHMINLQSQDDYPSLIIKSKSLAPEGERAPVVNKMGSFDPNRQSSLDVGKSKSSLSSSTPLHPQLQGRPPDASQLSTTPLHGGGLFDTDKQLPSKFAPRSLNFPSQSTPFAASGPKEPIETPPAVTQYSKPVFKVPLGKTYSMVPAKPDSTSTPSSGSGPPVSSLAKPDAVPPSNLDSSISSLSAASVRPNSARGSDTQRSKRRSTTTLTEEPELEQSLSSQSSSSVMDGLVSEVLDFEKELQTFINESANLDQFASSLGSTEDKVAMAKQVEDLSEFNKGINKITHEQRDEVKGAEQLLLECFASVQSVETHRKRIEVPAYRSALHARPLDMADQRKLKEIRTLYYHIHETMKEVGGILDDQWSRMMRKKPSSLHKSKRRMKMEERETVRQAIVNQTRILHNQEMNVLLLSQQLDKLRLFDTSWQMPIAEQFADSQQADDLNKSTDLPTLASSLINRGRDNGDRGDFAVVKPPKPSQASHISPKKAMQLSEFLASRKSAPIRTSFGKNSKFIAPTPAKPQPKEAQANVENVSHFSRFSSTSEYESEESSTTVESSKPSDGYRGPPPGYYLQSMESSARGQVSVEVLPSLPQHRPLAEMPSVFPPGHLRYPVDAASFLRAQSPAHPHFIEGSSTLSYGGPEGPASQKPPVKKFDVNAPMSEAASNLNNPPKVVNIKELSDPKIVNPLKAPKKFDANPSVPAGAAKEIQKVLNLVHAEQPKRDEASQRDEPPDVSKPDVSSTFSLPAMNRAANPQTTSPAAQPASGLAKPSLPTTQPFSMTSQPLFGGQQPSSGFARPSFGTLVPRSASEKDFATQPAFGIGNTAFGSQPLNGAAQASFGLAAQPSFGSVPPSTETTHVRTSSQPPSLVMKLPAAQPSSVSALGGMNLLKKSASEKHIPSSYEPAVKSQSASDRPPVQPGGPEMSLTMSQESSTRDPVAGDAPPEGTLLSGSAVANLAKEELSVKPQQAAKGPGFETGADIEAHPSAMKQDTAPRDPQAADMSLAQPAQQTVANTEETSPANGSGSESRKSSGVGQDEAPMPSAADQSTSNQLNEGQAVAGETNLPSTDDVVDNSGSTVIASEVPTIAKVLTTVTLSGPAPSSSDKEATESPNTLAPSSEDPSVTAKFGAASTFGTAPVTISQAFVPKTSTFGEAFVSQAPGATSMFGALVTSTTTDAGAPFGASASSFGALATSTTSSSGAPFGAAVTASASFGASTTTSGLFSSQAATTPGLFGGQASSSSGAFGVPATTSTATSVTTSNSVFGVSATTTQSPFAAAPSTNSLFGAPTTASNSLFSAGTATTTSSGPVFGVASTTSSVFAAATTSSGSVFGQTNASSGFGSVFGAPAATTSSPFVSNTATTGSSPFDSSATTSGSVFGAGNQPAFGSTGFGAAKFGAPAAFGAAPTTSASSFGGGFGASSGFGSGEGGFLSGLGSKPSDSSNTSNPFAAASSAPSADNNKSLFGNTATSSFSSTFGQSPSSAGAFSSNTNETQKGFGSFVKPSSGSFGGAAVFGSPPAFGSNPAFGAALQFGSSSFGSPSGFGSPATFGSQMGAATTASSGFGSSPGFGAFASSNVAGFGTLAEQSGSPGGFGSMNNQQQSGFGSGGFGSTQQPTSSKPSFSSWR